ncbi:MAG: tRNA pseudouridine(55) synthase TruB [Saprospirales bacterium]|nr:tRNA pseudouridine(55) synthase TruB [Saprospirales bacterium]MBK8490507.1 tRNA pseudouridine(55) synthase TruB [Saprospirales bacterium]
MPAQDPPPRSRLIPAELEKGAMLLVNKPHGWTSFDVVNKIRYKLKNILGVKKIKVGHAGTLDPMATGLLIVCTGGSTKKIDQYQGMPKEYKGTFTFGKSTPSYDAETEADAVYPFEHITAAMLEAVKTQFLGEIDQIPPLFSAIKVDGQPLYKKARRGIQVEVQPRKVHIHSIEWTRIELPEVDFTVRCSKGTYIRSLAHDIGQALDSGAYLSRLVRTQIGEYALENAWDLEVLVDELEELILEK